MLMGRQSPATQMATFSRTGLVIFLAKSWSVGWRSSNLGHLAFCRVLCTKVITSRRAASVIAKFSLTNATYNFSFVGCSVIFTLNQKLSAQQSLCSLHLQLPSRSLLFLTAGTRRFRVKCQCTSEVNKVALTALKYFIALIFATIIS